MDETAATRRPHRRRYWVWLMDHDQAADETGAPALLAPVQITVTYGDQLRGELEARKNGLDATAPMNFATCWVWAAMVRSKLYDGKFGAFKNGDLGELEPVETAEEAGEDEATQDPS